MNGLQANLALHYNSNRGNGLLGVGWAVGPLSAIARCPKTWAQDGAPAPIALQVSDGYCLDGQRLRLNTGNYGATGATYRTEIESFSRITVMGTTGTGPTWFKVESKDGLIHEYGNTADSRIEAGGSTSNPVSVWALNKIRDRSGNSIQFVYEEDTANGTFRIDHIDYPYTAANGGPHYRVDFVYETANRPDVLSGYNAGYAWQEPKRLDYIDILAISDSQQLRRYDVIWGSGTATNRSRISSIQECVGGDCLQPTAIGYENGATGWETTEQSAAQTVALMADALSMDINGDGRDDLVYPVANANLRVMLANGSGSGFASSSDLGVSSLNYASALPLDYNSDGKMDLLIPSGGNWHALTSNGTQFSDTDLGIAATGAGGNAAVADYNGDGRADLIYAVQPGTSNSALKGRLNTGTGFDSEVTLWAAPQDFALDTVGPTTSVFGTPQNYNRAVLRVIDFDGDGRADLLARLRIDIEFGVMHLWYPMRSTGTAFVKGTGALGSTNEQSVLADVNGDGLTDILTPGSTYWSVSLSKGNGTFVGAGTTVPVGAVAKAKVADWDGDGRTDLITSDGSYYYYSKSTGTGFATAVSLDIPDSSAVANVKMADINGDGLTDWVYSNGSNEVKFRRHSGAMADLGTAFADGFDISHDPSYQPLVLANYTKGSDAEFPYQDYQGPLHVVDLLTASTGSGDTYTQTYDYAGAQVHVQGRGFTGFALQKMHDSRDNLNRRQVRHLDFPYTGMVAESELRQANDQTSIQKTVNTRDKLEFGGTNEEAYFPYVEQSVTDLNELGGPQNTQPVSKQTTMTVVDSYGNPTVVTVVRQDVDDTSPWHTETFAIETQIAITNDDGSNWCLGRPHRTTVTSTAPNSSPQTRTTAATIDYAVCRATDQTVEPDSDTLKVVTTFGFDDCGNRTSEAVVGRKPDETAMATRTTSRSFGARCQLPVSVTNPLDQSSTLSHDYNLGLPLTATDPNGLEVDQSWDSFGRPQVTTRPDGTDTLTAVDTCSAGDNYCGTYSSDVRWQRQTLQRDTNDTVIRTESVTYDGFDRPRYLSTQLVGGAFSVVRRTYDSLGRLHREYAPADGGGNGYRQLTYDALGRVTADGLYTASGVLDRGSTIAYAGRKVTTTDPLLHETTRYTDVAGHLRRVVEPSPGGTTNYGFDPFGNLNSVTDAGGAVTTWTYNLNGALTALSHPDRGNWSYLVNSLGEMLSQTDAKSQTLTMTYDKLSRPLTRVEPEGTTTWTWGTSAAAHEIGQLNTVSGPGYSESYGFDAYGRLAATNFSTAEVEEYYIDQDYSATTGLPESLTYPTSTSGYRLRIRYDHDHGILNRVSDYNQSSTVFWQLNTTDARGHALDEQLGTAINVISGFDPLTGLMEYRTAGVGASDTNRQNLSFEWDANGNLKKRIDVNQSNLTEAFYYDALNRLDSTTRNGLTNLNVDHSANGNVVYRSDYPGGGVSFSYEASRPHAVRWVFGSCGGCCEWSDAFEYDANGNQTVRYSKNGSGSAVSWTSYNLPQVINLGPANASQFWYTPDRSRWKQVANYGGTTETTIYIGGLLEKVTRGNLVEFRHKIPAGPGSTVVYTRRSNDTVSTYYTTTDHLGSGTVTMDSSGATLVNLSFGAFGKRRGAAWNDVPSTADWAQITATGRDGFTGHEHLDNVGAIHMNGRVYDPQLGRFMSADPVYVGDLAQPQSLNPYSYVANNPGTRVDPTGFYDEIAEILVTTTRIRDFWEPPEPPVSGGWDPPGELPGAGGGGGGSGTESPPEDARPDDKQEKATSCGRALAAALAKSTRAVDSGAGLLGGRFPNIDTPRESEALQHFLNGSGTSIQLTSGEMASIRSYLSQNPGKVGTLSPIGDRGLQSATILLGASSQFDALLGTATGYFRGGHLERVEDSWDLDYKSGGRGSYSETYGYGPLVNVGTGAAGFFAEVVCEPSSFTVEGK